MQTSFQSNCTNPQNSSFNQQQVLNLNLESSFLKEQNFNTQDENNNSYCQILNQSQIFNFNNNNNNNFSDYENFVDELNLNTQNQNQNQKLGKKLEMNPIFPLYSNNQPQNLKNFDHSKVDQEFQNESFINEKCENSFVFDNIQEECIYNPENNYNYSQMQFQQNGENFDFNYCDQTQMSHQSQNQTEAQNSSEILDSINYQYQTQQQQQTFTENSRKLNQNKYQLQAEEQCNNEQITQYYYQKLAINSEDSFQNHKNEDNQTRETSATISNSENQHNNQQSQRQMCSYNQNQSQNQNKIKKTQKKTSIDRLKRNYIWFTYYNYTRDLEKDPNFKLSFKNQNDFAILTQELQNSEKLTSHKSLQKICKKLLLSGKSNIAEILIHSLYYFANQDKFLKKKILESKRVTAENKPVYLQLVPKFNEEIQQVYENIFNQ